MIALYTPQGNLAKPFIVIVAIIGGLALFIWSLATVEAHDSWISRGALKNQAGEWCCGDYDCKAYEKAESTMKGWMLDGEFVPFDEALPVAPPDGMVTVCRRPDGSRRCVFGVKPGI